MAKFRMVGKAQIFIEMDIEAANADEAVTKAEAVASLALQGEVRRLLCLASRSQTKAL